MMAYRKHGNSKGARRAHHKREKSRRRKLREKGGQVDPFGYADSRGKSRRQLRVLSVSKGARDGSPTLIAPTTKAHPMTEEPAMTNTDLIERLAKRGRIPEGGMFTDTMAACLDAKARIVSLEVEVVRLYGNAKANNMLARHETAGREEAAAALTEANAKLEALEAENKRLRKVLENPPKHRYWGAGEPDCPRELKAGNGELHTLRCKVCGNEDARSTICRGGL